MPQQHPSLRVARLLAESDAAVERVRARGDRPPWTNHPRRIDLVLFATDELSVRETTWMREHFAGCTACRARGALIADRLIQARTQQEALAIAREFIREGSRS